MRAVGNLVPGLLSLLAGALLPAVLTHRAFRILPQVQAGIEAGDSGRLLTAAASLVLLNALRAAPIYLGAFLLAEAVRAASTARPRLTWLSYGVPFGLIPLTYGLIEWMHGVRYDLGGPAVAGVLAAAVVLRMAEATHGKFTKGAILTVFLLGLQWLDVAPNLTRYGFGQGELSMEVKAAAEFVGAGALLDLWAAMGFGAFAALAFVMAKFMVDYRKHLQLVLAQKTQELQAARAEARAREEAVRSRALVEVQHLVHDLKTPLATIGGLVSLLAMELSDESRPLGGRGVRRHVAHIERAVATMSQMIGEILSPQAVRVVSGGELVRYLRSQVSALGGVRSGTGQPPVEFAVAGNLPDLCVNLLRLSRALLNLVTNAQHASGPEDRIRVRVSASRRALRIAVRDWGRGIDPEALERVFQPGVSFTGSSGMGLAFARKVVEEELGGTLVLHGRPGLGTLAVVTIPVATDREGDARSCEGSGFGPPLSRPQAAPEGGSTADGDGGR